MPSTRPLSAKGHRRVGFPVSLRLTRLARLMLVRRICRMAARIDRTRGPALLRAFLLGMAIPARPIVNNVFDREYTDFLWSYTPLAPYPGPDVRLSATSSF
jgi:hypothetical protein